MTHFDEMTCLLYLDGQLDAARASEVGAHLGSCSACRALLAALERESGLLKQALEEEDESVPARLLEMPGREAIPWGWIISMGFAAAGAYTLWTGVVEPWRSQLSQAGFGEGNLLTMLFFSGVFWKGWSDMTNLIQILAATTLGLPVAVVLLRHMRRWKASGVALCMLLAMLALPQPVGAAEIRHNQEQFVLPAGETVKNDLIVAAASARIEGTVEGDLILFSERAEISGHVTGDVIAFGHRLIISGQVDGNVRTFSAMLTLDGNVSKNATIFTNELDLGSKSVIAGSLILFAGTPTLDGRVGRDLLAYLGKGQMNGFIGGDATVRADRLSINSTAEIKGKTTVYSRRQPVVDSKAKLGSPLDFHLVEKGRPAYAKASFYWKQALRWGIAFIFGVVLIALMPGFFSETLASSKRYGPALGFGLVALVAVPILALIACITFVGIAVGVASVVLYLGALYSAKVIVGTWLGQKILGESSSMLGLFGRMALGTLILRVLAELPYAGGWIVLFYCVWALGAISLAVYRRLSPLPAAA